MKASPFDPEPAEVVAVNGRPVRVAFRKKTQKVRSVTNIWRIDDTWWQKPVARMYYSLELESGGLIDRPSGSAVLTAGYMVCLQMPPTAKGRFSFMTLEDEEGLINVVIKPEVYRAHRIIVRLEPFLLVEGIIEKKDGLINVKAKRFASLRQKKI